MMNPYYDTDKLGWKLLSLEAGSGYEFDTLAFFKTENGVFTAADSGCSCPTPFEGYEGSNAIEIEQQLERVPDVSAASRIIDAWRRDDMKYRDAEYSQVDVDEILRELEGWFK